MNRIPASTGWLWLKQGFGLFRKQPGFLVMLLLPQLIFTVLAVVLQPVGAIMYVLLMPSFSMVLLEANRAVAEGEKPSFGVILTGFRKGALGPLLKLGAVYLGLLLVFMMLMYPFLDQQAITAAFELSKTTKEPIKVPESMRGALTAMMFAASAVMFLLSFAAPLIHWKKMPTFKAIFYSVLALLASFRPVLVMLLVWGMIWMMVMTIGGAVLGSGVGAAVLTWFHLLMLVVFQCAIYTAYRQLIPDAHIEQK